MNTTYKTAGVPLSPSELAQGQYGIISGAPPGEEQGDVLIIGPHGEERDFVLGVMRRLYTEGLYNEVAQRVDYVCASPAATEQGVRFIETDLNRSFNAVNPVSYEEKRAQELTNTMKGRRIVLDLHTTSSKGVKAAIMCAEDLEGLEEEMGRARTARDLLAASPVAQIFAMPQEYTRVSLIGAASKLGALAISLEYSADNVGRAVQDVLDMLVKLTAQEAHDSEPTVRDIYYVEGKIPTTVQLGRRVRNLEPHYTEDEGPIYPIMLAHRRFSLFGLQFGPRPKTSYSNTTDFHSFYARKVERAYL